MKIKNIALATIMSAVIPTVAMAAEDPVIMTINGKDVTRSEFVYSYKKNNGDDVVDKKTVDEYVELFVNYKRKVEAALEAKLDTAKAYKREFCQYRDQQLVPTLINDDDVEKEARVIYENTKERIGADGLINPHHILIRVMQDADEEMQAKAAALADSIYNEIKKGADFAEMAKLSQDPGSARRGGDLGWISRGQTLKAFEDCAFALKVGEVSKPVLSEVGYHIVKMAGRKQMEPYDTLRGEIYEFIERRRLREEIAKNRLKDIAKIKNMTEEQVLNERADSISAIDPDMKYLIKEYHDGLLLYEISNREVWAKASKDEAGLQKFFKANKKKYTWDEPRFKGIAYYTRDVADIEAVKKALKGKKFDKWADVLRSTFNNDSVLRIRVEKGVFKKGSSGLVDKNEFGVADAKVKELKQFPYTDTYGRMITAPEELDDVRALVVGDYQDLKEKAWLKELEKKYPVKINTEVLATVKEEEK